MPAPIIEQYKNLRFHAARDTVLLVRTPAADYKVARVTFGRDGSLYVQFPYCVEKQGWIGELPPQHNRSPVMFSGSTSRARSKMKLNSDSIESHLLHLPPNERARLAELLLASLDVNESDVLSPESQADLDAAWSEETERRFHDLSTGAVAGIPAAQVYAELEAELRAFPTK